MPTAITPRLQRTIDYATQELFAIDPGYIQPLMSDIALRQQDDWPEPHITVFILECLVSAIKVATVEKLLADPGALREILGG